MDDVIAKVQALLAKAESTPFEAERDAFYAKAQELMLKHAIDEAQLAAANGGAQKTPIVERYEFAPNQAYRPGKIHLIHAIATANRVKLVLHGGSKKAQRVSMVGFAEDVEFVKAMYQSLVATGLGDAREAAKRGTGGLSTYAFGSEFLVGFASRIGERLAAQMVQAKEAEMQSRGASTALVLADRAEAVDRAYDDAFPSLRSSHVGTRGGWGAGDARRAGRAAGDRANLARGAVGGRKALAR